MIRPRDVLGALHITPSDLKLVLDDLQITYVYEELLPLMASISSSRDSKISFSDWIRFAFYSKVYKKCEDFEKLIKYSGYTWASWYVTKMDGFSIQSTVESYNSSEIGGGFAGGMLL